MTNLDKLNIRTGLKLALAHLDEGDPIEAESGLMTILTAHQDRAEEDHGMFKLIEDARTEVATGSPEKGEHLIEEAISHLVKKRQLLLEVALDLLVDWSDAFEGEDTPEPAPMTREFLKTVGRPSRLMPKPKVEAAALGKTTEPGSSAFDISRHALAGLLQDHGFQTEIDGDGDVLVILTFEYRWMFYAPNETWEAYLQKGGEPLHMWALETGSTVTDVHVIEKEICEFLCRWPLKKAIAHAEQHRNQSGVTLTPQRVDQLRASLVIACSDLVTKCDDAGFKAVCDAARRLEGHTAR